MEGPGVEALYTELVRGVDCQAKDLESIRTHCGQAVVLGGVAAGVFVQKDTSLSGVGTLVGISFLFILIACAAVVYWPLKFRYSTFDDVPQGPPTPGFFDVFHRKCQDNGWRLTRVELTFVTEQVRKGLATTALTNDDMTKGELLSELAKKTDDGFWRTYVYLERRWRWHNLALAALVAEVLAFLAQRVTI